MKGYKVKLNSRIEFNVDKKTYKTTIQDIGEDSFFISIPVVDGEYLTLNLKESAEMFNYIDENVLYKIKCNVIGKKIDNGIPLYQISMPIEAIKIQRRNYVRVNMLQPIKYSKISEEEKEIIDGMLPALLLDLSGGGMRIKLTEELFSGDTIAAVLKSDGLLVNAKGKVVRKEKTPDRKFIYGISFWKMDDKVRERIIKDVFTTMRKQREIG